MQALVDLSRADLLPDFSGTFKYETDLHVLPSSGKRMLIDIGEVFETAEVFVNGESAGVRLAGPYQFDITDLIKEGTNSLTIEVTNTLVKEMSDFLSTLDAIEPSGLLGPVMVFEA